MSTTLTPEATRRVLLDIDRACAPIIRARTAAAVERVLRTASPGTAPETWDVLWLTQRICDDVGVKPVRRQLCSEVDCDCLVEESFERIEATPGMTTTLFGLVPPINEQRRRYAPEVVSPHLFEDT